MPLPAINPFLVAANLVRMKRGGTIEIAKDQVSKSNALVLLDLDEKVSLRYAGEGQFFDTNIVHKHEDDVPSQCCAAVYARYHYITETMIARLLVPQRHADHSAGRAMHRRQILKWQTQFQTHVMKIYHAGVNLLVEEMGGLGEWSNTTTAQHTVLTSYRRSFSLSIICET